MKAEDLIQSLVDAEGVFSTPRPEDFHSGNYNDVLMKRVGKLLVCWGYDYLQVGVALETPTEWNYISGSVAFSREKFGHLSWWKNAHRSLIAQSTLAKLQPEVDELAALLTGGSSAPS